MKPYNFSGGNHHNMSEIAKWARSSLHGVRRAPFPKQDRSRRRLTNVRGRRAGREAVHAAIETLGQDE